MAPKQYAEGVLNAALSVVHLNSFQRVTWSMALHLKAGIRDNRLHSLWHWLSGTFFIHGLLEIATAAT